MNVIVSFPILVDIYAEPIISELCNVYPVSAPVASIPKITIMANIRGYGGTVSEVRMPTALQLIRPGALQLSMSAGVSNNIFTIATAMVAPATVSSTEYRINRRYTMITQVVVLEAAGAVTHTVPVTVRPDNRSQFVGTFSFISAATGATIVGEFQGHINYDSGIFTYQIIYNTAGYTTTSATMTIRFMSMTTMNGRINVKIKTEMTDVN